MGVDYQARYGGRRLGVLSCCTFPFGWGLRRQRVDLFLFSFFFFFGGGRGAAFMSNIYFFAS